MNLQESCLCNLVPQAAKADLTAFFRDETREIIYSLLSAAFSDEPSKDLLDYIESNTNQIVDFFSSYNGPQSTLCLQGMEQLSQSLINFHKNPAPLRKEFGLLFLNTRGIKPFESVYRGFRKELMGKPWMQVKIFYESTGILKADNKGHLEDHASVELMCMAKLAFMSASASTETPDKDYTLLQIQNYFLTQHVLCWFPELCGDIQARESVPFYHIISRIGKNWVSMDHQFLKHALDQ